LADKSEAHARTLSGGMRRRLMMAKALNARRPCWYWTANRRGR
jgi:ABC-type multidrug transport system ATPase subunit